MNKLKIILFVLLFFCISIFIYYYYTRPVYAVEFYGTWLVFRANLKEAAKVPVYPDENSLKLAIKNPLLQNITFAFKDAGLDKNGYYIIEQFEIINKLYLLYKIMGIKVNFSAQEIQDYQNLSASEGNLIIALVHPIYANKTSIEVKDNVIYLQGTDLKNFDMATVKLLMVALELKV